MPNTLNQFWDWSITNRFGPNAGPPVIAFDYSDMYQKFYDWYNNDTSIAEDDTTRRLRTVVNRSVEFYASKMLPGKEIGVSASRGEGDAKIENVALRKAIEQIIKDSNLGNNKPAMLRGFALYGDSFLRVRGDNEKSYLEDISPFYVTDFSEDSRGFLTYIRIDIPVLINNSPGTYTEYWDTETQLYQSWENSTHGRTSKIEDLGIPTEEIRFGALGIDFIPIVHTKFRDNGDARGLSCFYHAADKIYEANRMATRLHDLVFRFGKPVIAVSANDKDQAGRPLPPPPIDTSSTGNATASETNKEGPLGDVWNMPGLSKVDFLIPNIDYSDILSILNAQMSEIEEDLPELRWYKLSATEKASMSGTALRTLLGAAIDRANEARNNFLHSLSRAMEMALTIGQFNNLEGFAGLGTFDSGDFEHELVVDDSWGESTAEKGTTMASLTQAGIPAPAAMKLAGFSEEQVTEAFPTGGVPDPNTPPVAPGTTRTQGNGKRVVTPVRVN